MTFHDIFQVGACSNLKDSSLYERFSIHMNKALCNRYLQLFLRYLRLRYALQGTSFWKKMIFPEIFQVGACPNLKDSSLYESFSNHKYKACSIRYLQHLPLSATPLCLQRYFFMEKDYF